MRCVEATGEGDPAALRTVLDNVWRAAGGADVAYAVRAWLTDDPHEAAWTARQIYEAADYAALYAHPDLQLDVPGAEQLLLESPMVQTALAGLSADLVTVEAAPAAGWDDLHERARAEGVAWAATLPGGDR